MTDFWDGIHGFIGARRSQLIAAEGEYDAQIIAGTLTDLSEVVWP